MRDKIFGWKQQVNLAAVKLLSENDYEKVVRCLNCKFLEIEDFAYGFCGLTHISVDTNDYCSRGVKRDDQE